MRDSAPIDEREIRAARNQSLFRAVNEKMRMLNETFAIASETFVIACECADTTCVVMLDLRPDEYEAVRASPRSFAVAPGHVLPEAEDVVDGTDRFEVVKKRGAAAELAEELAERMAALDRDAQDTGRAARAGREAERAAG